MQAAVSVLTILETERVNSTIGKVNNVLTKVVVEIAGVTVVDGEMI